jgi:glutamate-1-semialdehyde 2,1-aminomutase
MGEGQKLAVAERLLRMPERSAIENRYRSATPGSAALIHRASSVLPGGNTRTTSYYPPYPIVLERGEGPWLTDVDQHRYVDLFQNGLSLAHGNDYAPVRTAIEATLRHGMGWSGTSREQIAFAELLSERLPALELLRFTNSGSEAGMLAVKAARRITGRPLIVKSIGAYHGSYPDLEAGLYGQGDIQGRTLVAPFNDLLAFERLMAAHGTEVAAIVIEPVLVTGRVAAPAPGFLQGLEELARRHGALSILDDCLMLRLAVGGSVEKFALRPDLVVLGKFLGGGTPLGAFGGARDLMRIFDPTRPRPLFHGGSFNGNPVGCAAGLVTLQHLTGERIAAMDERCQVLRAALVERAAELGLEVCVTGTGSVAGISFAADPARHEDDPSVLGLASLFHLACANEGVLIGPGGIMSVSSVHDSQTMNVAIAGVSRALAELASLLGTLG